MDRAKGPSLNTIPKAVALVVLAVMPCATACQRKPSACGTPPSADRSTAGISLRDKFAAGQLRSMNRAASVLDDGDGVRVTAAQGIGLIWIDETQFADGTVEADVCGRDVQSESFVGIAFHRQNDDKYEAVFLRPFNFRSSSPERIRHAVQYVAMPHNDFAHLRASSPGEFENSVAPSAVPDGWNHLRLIVRGRRVQVFVGDGNTAALDVRALQSESRGLVGLFVGNGSDGVFANLRVVRSN